MKQYCFLLLLLYPFLPSSAQPHGHGHDHHNERAIHFPDTDQYLTLVADLHMHTVFSDGSVWPDIRVEEAVRDSLDAISLTEHLEYQPHAEDLPHPDRNRAHDIAAELALPHDLMVLRGAEVTRSMPPGHSNAIFIQDANKLLIDDPVAAFEEANRQGAFTFWNHPNWIAQREDGVATLTDMHRDLIRRKLLHGIEVVNDLTISKEAFRIALDNNLTVMGTSDIHGLVDWQYDLHKGGHRPVTLVLATERTPEAMKAALIAGRTVAWFENTLVGREENVRAVVEASLRVTSAAYFGASSVVEVTIHNDSDAAYLLENLSGYSLQSDLGPITLSPNGSTSVNVMTLKQLGDLSLKFRVLNAMVEPEKALEVTLQIKPE
ncbi:Sb-PDE family phosphodiesterase [Neolewinella persica]|uniref:Sb-PDE family phosphodiesterase n=1 Tax=Neolewinella persica TaxID=70998 RepID=UPI0005C6F562|nr:Sb-PDE family phosphodiesterase [Neolewinella persica]